MGREESHEVLLLSKLVLESEGDEDENGDDSELKLVSTGDAPTPHW